MDYSLLPKVDRVLDAAEKQLISQGHTVSRAVLIRAVQGSISAVKDHMTEGATKESLFNRAVDLAVYRAVRLSMPHLRPVINATGVVLHTNLGRAPLAKEAAEAVYRAARGYSNLEMDLDSGKRGSRYDHVTDLLCSVTGAEDAVVVNNNAAAVLVVLDTLARGGEAIVSRGQLIEIGGSFRIPEVIEKSDAVLKEVGATNKTHLYDYERAIGENTSCILQVHPSNFTMEGFVEEVSTRELSNLARKHSLPFIYDLGSGCLYPFAEKGIGREPLPRRIIEEGADILTFSGDKLLGGPQAGVIVGKAKYIEKIKKNPLIRALRIDKLTLAALEATLTMYRDGKEEEIPAIAMITAPEEYLLKKAQKLYKLLSDIPGKVTVSQSVSPVGGGSLPDVKLNTYTVEVSPQRISAGELLQKLRRGDTAVLAYIRENTALFDTRTVFEDEIPLLAQAIKEALK